jgi:cell pole-organizing protein PopZ
MEARASSQDAKSQDAKADGKQGAAGEEDLSMEEILQSIRRIIAEDDKDAARKPEARTAAKNPGKEDDIPGSDVFELTEMLKEDGSVVNVKAEMAKEAAARDVLNKIDEALVTEKKTAPADIKPEAKPAAAPAAGNSQGDTDALLDSISPPAPVAAEPAPVAAAASPRAAEQDSGLLSQEAASASMSAFNKLKSIEQYVPPASGPPAPAFRDGTTVEDLVTEMLRPMMKGWLDANLPQIVERIVEREIRKLTQ